jgi:hypothetical protein
MVYTSWVLVMINEIALYRRCFELSAPHKESKILITIDTLSPPNNSCYNLIPGEPDTIQLHGKAIHNCLNLKSYVKIKNWTLMNSASSV